ncbi:MAG: HD domain-containing protein [Rhodocyclaceae bacterium]|nr:HD domain-containing protein [Rhodocyclaceae bacterium]
MPRILGEPILSPRFALALQFANQVHSAQVRKGGRVPYITHLMSVCALVLENGGDEDEAIGALLHDAAEDCGGRPMLESVRTLFGTRVADIVEGCTDTLEDPKPDWRRRKEAYVVHLRTASPSVKLVAGCDKLHNLSSTLKDLRGGPGPDYWVRFTADAAAQAWYYGACAEALEAAPASPVAGEFRRVFGEFQAILAGHGVSAE